MQKNAFGAGQCIQRPWSHSIMPAGSKEAPFRQLTRGLSLVKCNATGTSSAKSSSSVETHNCLQASLIFKLKLKDQAPDRLCTFISMNSETFSSIGRWLTLSHLHLVKPWITCVTIVAGQLYVHSSGKLLGIFNFSQISSSIRDTDLLAYLLVPLI
jgi:hypothetical protein